MYELINIIFFFFINRICVKHIIISPYAANELIIGYHDCLFIPRSTAEKAGIANCKQTAKTEN